MVRFIILTFFFMGLGFYELSGGSEFEPTEWRDVSSPVVETEILAKVETAPQPVEAELAVETEATQPVVSKAESPLVVLASIPTTRRLVGDSAPTPLSEKALLGPEPSAATEQDANQAALEAATSFQADTADFRRVTGNRVNMRNGPGTQYSVVGKLLRDDEVEVLQDPGIGWVKLQVLETGRIGWMSANLLAKVEF